MKGPTYLKKTVHGKQFTFLFVSEPKSLIQNKCEL